MRRENDEDLQAIQRRRRLFVGRGREVQDLRQNLALPPADNRRIFVFDVYGQGGVGKTWLAHEFHQVALGVWGNGRVRRHRGQ